MILKFLVDGSRKTGLSGLTVYKHWTWSQHNEKPGRPQWKMEYATPSSKVTQVFGC